VKTNERSTFLGIGCGVIVAALLVSAAIGALLWPYTINAWLLYAGREAKVAWWQGALLGVCPFLGQLSIPAAVITWILMMVIR
jgi:hypothetical protein